MIVGCWSSPLTAPPFGEDDSYQRILSAGAFSLSSSPIGKSRALVTLSCGFERTKAGAGPLARKVWARGKVLRCGRRWLHGLDSPLLVGLLHRAKDGDSLPLWHVPHQCFRFLPHRYGHVHTH